MFTPEHLSYALEEETSGFDGHSKPWSTKVTSIANYGHNSIIKGITQPTKSQWENHFRSFYYFLPSRKTHFAQPQKKNNQ